MADKFTFDGPGKLVIVNDDQVIGGVVNFSVYDVYSEWKRWVQASDNAKYDPAFRGIGGDPIGGGQSVGFYLFLRNDLGWRLYPPAVAVCRIVVEGSLFGEDSDLCLLTPRSGRSVTLIVTNSALVTGVPTGGGGDFPTTAQIATAVWGHASALDLSTRMLLASKILRNRHDTDPTTGEDLIYDDDGVTVLLRGDLWENVAGTVPYRGQGANRRDRLV